MMAQMSKGWFKASMNGSLKTRTTPVAAEMFEAVLARDPCDPRARYYAAMAQAQAGAAEPARRHRARSLDGLGPTSAVHPAVKRRYERMGDDGG